jgi:hypothetical protein
VNSIAPSGSGKLVGFGDDVPFELRLAQTIAWCAPRPRVEDPSFAEYIVAWVPAAFVKHAARGVDVNVGGCLAWLADASTRVTSELRMQGLVE